MQADLAAARLVTEDLVRFWTAFDAALDAADPQAVFERLYLQPGTPGLQEFRRLRAEQVAHLGATVSAKRAFYASIRHTSLRVHHDRALLHRLRDMGRAFQRLVPAARRPDTTLLIGALGTGGCPSPSGNLIGLEFFLREPDTPTHELNTWEQANLFTLDDLPFMVAHETVHLVQGVSEADLDARPTLLWMALQEGAADYVASLATGEAPRGAHHVYGPAHEAALWAEFQSDMYDPEVQGWLYQGNQAGDRPADLGYFVGHQIVRAYHQRALDRHQVVAELLSIRDATAFLHASGYAPS